MEAFPVNGAPTVFVIDDDPAVCRALSASVRSMQLRAKAFVSAREFLDAFDPWEPGCILLDVRMPEISGLELLEQLRQKTLHPPVIIVSGHGDVPMVVRALKAGAINFLEKPCRDQQLWEAIQEALKQDEHRRKNFVQHTKTRRRISRLTAGEHDVLEMLVAGNSNKAIAEQLGMSVRTIEVRRAKVMQKMQAASLAELVRLALSVDGHCGKPQAAFGKLH